MLTNPAPNSAWSVRSVYLIRAKEDDPWILHNVVPYTDKCRSSLQKESVVIVGDGGKAFDVSFKISDSMKDLKLKKIQSGKGGADCLLCKFPQPDWKNTELIEKGFPITTTAQRNYCYL